MSIPFSCVPGLTPTLGLIVSRLPPLIISRNRNDDSAPAVAEQAGPKVPAVPNTVTPRQAAIIRSLVCHRESLILKPINNANDKDESKPSYETQHEDWLAVLLSAMSSIDTHPQCPLQVVVVHETRQDVRRSFVPCLQILQPFRKQVSIGFQCVMVLDSGQTVADVQTQLQDNNKGTAIVLSSLSAARNHICLFDTVKVSRVKMLIFHDFDRLMKSEDGDATFKELVEGVVNKQQCEKPSPNERNALQLVFTGCASQESVDFAKKLACWVSADRGVVVM